MEPGIFVVLQCAGCVYDNTDLNTVLVDKLNLSGFEASGAGDGEDGLKRAKDTGKEKD